MNDAVQHLARKLPFVREYLSRVRDERKAMQLQLRRQASECAALREQVQQLSQNQPPNSGVHEQVSALKGCVEAMIGERSVLVADLMAARTAVANMASLMGEDTDQADGTAWSGANNVRLFYSKKAYNNKLLIDQLNANRQMLLDRIANLEAIERNLRQELTRSSSVLQALTAAKDDSDQGGSIKLLVLCAQVVEGLFELLLDRKPLAEETVRFCDELAAGRSFQEIANDVLLSADGRKDRRNLARFSQIYDSSLPFPLSILPHQSLFPIVIVDVGAQLLDVMDHVYAPMLQDRLCTVIGFEPLEEEAAQRSRVDASARILPYFIGDGEPATFHVNVYNPTSSLLPSNPEMFKFKGLHLILPTVSTERVRTRRLDDISEVALCDYLKIDVQGGEQKVLAGAKRLLERVCIVHTEVEFDAVYLGQPLFGDIDRVVRDAGFELVDLLAPGYETYREAPPGCAGSRLLWNDAVYMKRQDRMSEDMLLKSAYIAHANYRKYDLAAHLLAIYDDRCKTKLHQAYTSFFASRQPVPDGARGSS